MKICRKQKKKKNYVHAAFRYVGQNSINSKTMLLASGKTCINRWIPSNKIVRYAKTKTDDEVPPCTYVHRLNYPEIQQYYCKTCILYKTAVNQKCLKTCFVSIFTCFSIISRVYSAIGQS